MKTITYTHKKSNKDYTFQIDQETKGYYIEFRKGYIKSMKSKVNTAALS